ncbi:hypothetical protein MPSEU_000681100 [Mayamaea pseudoterrestris]|nr:hypothetical protein MPSEU_000681100 [Mayamaea pseudoterrestris]
MGIFKKKQSNIVPSIQLKDSEEERSAAAARGASNKLVERLSKFQRVQSKDSADTRSSTSEHDKIHLVEYVPPQFDFAMSSSVFQKSSSKRFQILDNDDVSVDESILDGVTGSSSPESAHCSKYQPPPTFLSPTRPLISLMNKADALGTPGDESVQEETFRQFVFDKSGISGVAEKKSDSGTQDSDIFRLAAAATLNIQSTKATTAEKSKEVQQASRCLELDVKDTSFRSKPTFEKHQASSVVNIDNDNHLPAHFDGGFVKDDLSFLEPATFMEQLSMEMKAECNYAFENGSTRQLAEDFSKIADDLEWKPTQAFSASMDDITACRSFPNATAFTSGKQTSKLQTNVVQSPSFTSPLKLPSQSKSSQAVSSQRITQSGFTSSFKFPSPSKTLTAVTSQQNLQSDEVSITSRSSRTSYKVSPHQRHTPSSRRRHVAQPIDNAFKVIDAVNKPFAAWKGAPAEENVADHGAMLDENYSSFLTAESISRLNVDVSAKKSKHGSQCDFSTFSNANATVFHASTVDPFADLPDDLENENDPFQIGIDNKFNSAWDLKRLPTFPNKSVDPLIESIRRASKQHEPFDTLSRSTKPDPSPRAIPASRSDGDMRANNNGYNDEWGKEGRKPIGDMEIPHTCSDGALGTSVKNPMYGQRHKQPSVVPANAILGSMLFRQMDSTASAGTHMKPPPPSQVLNKPRRAASQSTPTKEMTSIPSTIEAAAADDASAISNVTEAVSSAYVNNFEAWKQNARNALTHYSNMKKVDYRPSARPAGDGRDSKNQSQRVTWMNRVQEEHRRIFEANKPATARQTYGGAT